MTNAESQQKGRRAKINIPPLEIIKLFLRICCAATSEIPLEPSGAKEQTLP